MDWRECGSGDSQLAKQGFFLKAVLRGLQCCRRRKDRNAFTEKSGGSNGNIFEFVGYKFKPAGKFFKRGFVVKIGGDALGYAAHGRFRRGVEKTEPQTQWVAGQRQHVSKLTATQDANGHEDFLDLLVGGRRSFFLNCACAEGLGASRTRLVWASRNLRSDSRIAGYLVPRFAAVSSADLLAPDLPTAKV